MNDDARDTPPEDVRNSQLLRAEYGIPSAKDEAWRNQSRVAEESLNGLTSRRSVERSIDPLEMARTEEVIARARFFKRLRVATDTGGTVVVTTVSRVIPVIMGCAVAALIGVSVVALLVLARNERLANADPG